MNKQLNIIFTAIFLTFSVIVSIFYFLSTGDNYAYNNGEYVVYGLSAFLDKTGLTLFFYICLTICVSSGITLLYRIIRYR